jgi:hypothetical protein
MTQQDDRLWEDMLAEFRALGGTADNICLGEGSFGRGLFPCDFSKPIEIHIPESLLVPLKNVRIENGAIRVDADAQVSQRAAEFAEVYQRDFSWGPGYRRTQGLLQMFHEAPSELRELLRSRLDLDCWLVPPDEATTFERFFQSRTFTYNGTRVLIPVVDLANHGRGATYECDNGIGLSGHFVGEILVQYNACDPLDILSNWGFASREPFALSLQLRLKGPAGSIVIERKSPFGGEGRTPFLPDMFIEGDKLTLSYMLLGHKRLPRMAKAAFCKLMRDAGRPNPETAFDNIQHINRMTFLGLIGMCERAATPLATLLRNMARYQLEAMSHHIGTRDI